MIHAYYSEYLPDVRKSIGTLFDLAYYQLELDIDELSERFAASEIAGGIESGCPKYLAGMSGIEMAMEVFGESAFEQPPYECTDAFWVGYALAHLQWYYNRPFKEIITKYPCSRLLAGYPVLHEADIGKTVDVVQRFIIPGNIVKLRRKKIGMTQRELAALVGISLPALRAYEQGVIELENASGRTLYLLGRYLGLTVEELLLG